jgi:osmotically-inducible protein OsmY
LAGCFGVALGGAAGAALSVADRRSFGAQTDDAAIEVKAGQRMPADIQKCCHLNFTSFNRRVLITGEVTNDDIKKRVGAAVLNIENVEAIWNEAAIGGNSTLLSRSNDSFITSKVKGRFIDSKKFSANHVKVVTEAGVVYLLGIVSRAEADAAIQVARTTDGVKKVVSVLQIVSPAELNRINESIANSATSNKTQQ